jgi:hypothetical protein
VFVVLVGGAIVWLRLHALRLPANPVVAALPRDLFLVVGIRYPAWPLFLGSVAFAAIWALRRPGALAWLGERPWWQVGIACAAVVVVVGSTATVVVWQGWIIWEQVTFGVAVAIVVVVAVIFARKRRRLPAWAPVVAVAFTALVGAAVELGDVRVLPVRFEYARAYLEKGGLAQGFLVGGPSSTVYLAPNKADPTRRCDVRGRIVAVPRDRVVRLVIFPSSKAWSAEATPPATCLPPPRIDLPG